MNTPVNSKISALQSKGGIMFFTIERHPKLYKGTIMLSPVKNQCQRRAVYIKEYLIHDK